MFPINPYVAGNPVGDSPAFVGRADVLQEVLRVLRHSRENAMVLYGQRRIGKTSVLQELAAKLPKEGKYRPVYFDLQDKVRWPLEKVLKELAKNISEVLNQNQPNLDADPETAFRQIWLPQWLGALPADTLLVLLFDEFDVLVDVESKHTSEAFFRYLRQLLNNDSQPLKFVFVIGRNIDDLTTIAQSLFKGTSSKRVSLLSQEDTIKLARLSEDNNTLQWSKAAIENIWQLTNGHPFLTQRLCSRVWERLYDDKPVTSPLATLEHVKAAISSTLDASRNTLEWLWGGLPPAERVVASALAEAEAMVITESQLQELLKQSGVQVLIRELQNAPRLLQDWDLIEGTAKEGYRFRVELLRRWIAEHKPLNKVRDELDRIEPVADLIYQAGLGLYRVGKLQDALLKMREAVKLNPSHLSANQLLADILLAQGQPNEAREILEQLYTYQPDTIRPRLIQALLESAQTSKGEDEQVRFYERVLELEVNELTASQRLAEIFLARDQIDKALDILEKLYNDKPDTARPLLIKTLLTQTQSGVHNDHESKKTEVYKRLAVILKDCLSDQVVIVSWQDIQQAVICWQHVQEIKAKLHNTPSPWQQQLDAGLSKLTTDMKVFLQNRVMNCGNRAEVRVFYEKFKQLNVPETDFLEENWFDPFKESYQAILELEMKDADSEKLGHLMERVHKVVKDNQLPILLVNWLQNLDDAVTERYRRAILG
ncbi:MAG: hypothetical protein BWK78_02540 [Thiotrichaceae bacterium IS1]|nr:MAG: hypothetical protein BWK78_02540 [Thiotrichaceae bacterium IS1]